MSIDFAITPTHFPSEFFKTSETFVLVNIFAPDDCALFAKNLYVFLTSKTAAFATLSEIVTEFFGEQKENLFIEL